MVFAPYVAFHAQRAAGTPTGGFVKRNWLYCAFVTSVASVKKPATPTSGGPRSTHAFAVGSHAGVGALQAVMSKPVKSALHCLSVLPTHVLSAGPQAGGVHDPVFALQSAALMHAGFMSKPVRPALHTTGTAPLQLVSPTLHTGGLHVPVKTLAAQSSGVAHWATAVSSVPSVHFFSVAPTQTNEFGMHVASQSPFAASHRSGEEHVLTFGKLKPPIPSGTHLFSAAPWQMRVPAPAHALHVPVIPIAEQLPPGQLAATLKVDPSFEQRLSWSPTHV